MTRLLKVSEVAEHFRVTEETVRVWIAKGKIAHVNISSGKRPTYRIPPEALTTSIHVENVVPKPQAVKSHF